MFNSWLKFLDTNAELGYVVLFSISFFYLYVGRAMKLYKRLFASSHGLILSISLPFAAIASKYTYFGYSGWIVWTHVGLGVIGLLSIIYSIWIYRKWWYINILHVLTLSYGFLFMFYGGMHIAHDWV